MQGHFEAAIADYTTAIRLNPTHCRAYYNRAFSYDRIQQYGAAIADYTKALEIEPNNATAYHNRGSLHERLGRCVNFAAKVFECSHPTACCDSSK